MFIYLVTNKINGKQYVGQTQRSIKDRWLEHCYEGDSLLRRFIKKYGRKNFYIDQISLTNNIQELNEKEVY